jgi:hypothetical protein
MCAAHVHVAVEGVPGVDPLLQVSDQRPGFGAHVQSVGRPSTRSCCDRRDLREIVVWCFVQQQYVSFTSGRDPVDVGWFCKFVPVPGPVGGSSVKGGCATEGKESDSLEFEAEPTRRDPDSGRDAVGASWLPGELLVQLLPPFVVAWGNKEPADSVGREQSVKPSDETAYRALLLAVSQGGGGVAEITEVQDRLHIGCGSSEVAEGRFDGVSERFPVACDRDAWFVGERQVGRR